MPISKAGTRPEASFSGKSISFSFPRLQTRVRSHTPRTLPICPAPHFRSPCPANPPGWPQGEGPDSRPSRPSLTSAGALQPPARSREPRGRRAPTWAVSHAVSAQESPPGPRRRPAVPHAGPAAPTAPPAARPSPPGREGGICLS